MFTRCIVPVAFALMLAARPALADDAGFLGLQLAPDDSGKGVRVVSVFPDSPADKAGVKADDVVADMDGTAANDVKALVGAVAAHKPGDEINLKVMRNGKEMSFKVKLGKRPTEPPAPPAGNEPFVGEALRAWPRWQGGRSQGRAARQPSRQGGSEKGRYHHRHRRDRRGRRRCACERRRRAQAR